MAGDSWDVGDHVEVDKIPTKLTGRNRSWLKIHKFDGDEDEEDPVVVLNYKEMDGKHLARDIMYHVRMSELKEVGSSSNVRMPAGARTMLGLPDVFCGCHCGEKTSGNEFRQGHDARLKGALQRWANGRTPKETLTDKWVTTTLQPEQAAQELQRRGWPPGRA